MAALLEDKRRMSREAEEAVRQCAAALARSPGLEEALQEREPRDVRSSFEDESFRPRRRNFRDQSPIPQPAPAKPHTPPRERPRELESLEETLARQLSTTTRRLDDISASKSSADNVSSRLQRENDILRGLLSQETLANNRRLASGVRDADGAVGRRMGRDRSWSP